MSDWNRGSLYYLLFPLLSVVCLLQATAASQLKIYGVKSALVLLVIVLGALIYGRRPGALWASFGATAMENFSGGPLGSSSLALMAAALVAGVGHRTLS